jgi:hypothetical protein
MAQPVRMNQVDHQSHEPVHGVAGCDGSPLSGIGRASSNLSLERFLAVGPEDHVHEMPKVKSLGHVAAQGAAIAVFQPTVGADEPERTADGQQRKRLLDKGNVDVGAIVLGFQAGLGVNGSNPHVAGIAHIRRIGGAAEVGAPGAVADTDAAAADAHGGRDVGREAPIVRQRFAGHHQAEQYDGE